MKEVFSSVAQVAGLTVLYAEHCLECGGIPEREGKGEYSKVAPIYGVTLPPTGFVNYYTSLAEFLSLKIFSLHKCFPNGNFQRIGPWPILS